MWKSISKWILRVSNGWVALSGLVIFILFTAFVLPRQASSSEVYSDEVGNPDTSFTYSQDDLYSMAEAYGAAGRAAYVRARYTFDVVWPLVYTFFLSTVISWLGKRAFSRESPWQRANLAPLLGALFDFLENASTSLIMLRYPETTPGIDVLAGYFTMLKWVLVTASFVFLLIGLVAGAYVWIKKKRGID